MAAYLNYSVAVDTWQSALGALGVIGCTSTWNRPRLVTPPNFYRESSRHRSEFNRLYSAIVVAFRQAETKPRRKKSFVLAAAPRRHPAAVGTFREASCGCYA